MKPIVFLDSSVVIASVGSQTGASRAIFDASRDKKIICLSSEAVIEEIEPRLYKVNKLLSEVLDLIHLSGILTLPYPDNQGIEKYKKIVTDPKDAHVFASSADIPHCVLVSLDKKHILSLSTKMKHPKIMSPAEFLPSLL